VWIWPVCEGGSQPQGTLVLHISDGCGTEAGSGDVVHGVLDFVFLKHGTETVGSC